MKTRINNIFKTNNYKLKDKIYNRYGFDKIDRKNLNNIKLNKSSEEDMLFFDVNKIDEFAAVGPYGYVEFICMVSSMPNLNVVFSALQYRGNEYEAKSVKILVPNDGADTAKYIAMPKIINLTGNILLGSNGVMLHKENFSNVTLYDLIKGYYEVLVPYGSNEELNSFIENLKSAEVKREEVVQWLNVQ